MKNYWSQPSLSRDFALLSVAIFTVLFFMSMWVTFITYKKHNASVEQELQVEANRIEMTLASEMERANYLLTALGRQIVVNNARDMVELSQILKAYDAKDQIYAIFNWIDVDQKVIVSSGRGILDKPIDISDRDFVKKCFVEPWKMHIGRPIEGRVSGRWVIPVAMGLTDYTGKFIGTILISLDISQLTNQISMLIKRDGMSFAIISRTLIPLTQVSEDNNFLANNFPAQKLVNIDYVKNPAGLISQASSFFGAGNYSYYSASAEYPYIILMGYDNSYQDDTVMSNLISRLLQMVIIAAFFILFLIIVRSRMIVPLMQMTDSIEQVARGNTQVTIPVSGPIEVSALASQMNRVIAYIDENKRMDDELRNKLFIVRKALDEMEIAKHSKSEFLAYICQDMRSPLNSAMGCAQVMKDQIYGPIENKKYRQYAEDIYGSCKHIIAQLDYVLELARTEAHYNVLRESTIDIGAVINRACDNLFDHLQSSSITIKTSITDDAMMLYADEFRIYQIVTNSLLFFIGQNMVDTTLNINVMKTFFGNDKQVMNIVFATEDHIINASPNTQLELIRRLAELHQGSMIVDSTKLVVSLPASRVRYNS